MAASLEDHHHHHQALSINGENNLHEKKIICALPTNGGSGKYSYSRNSNLQRQSSSLERKKIEQEIFKKLDVKKLASSSNNTIRIADLGCATGPNAFFHTHYILEAIKHKFKTQTTNNTSSINNNTVIVPIFQVFFNDLPSNDFNTLFTILPQDREYFAAGVPGSFYGSLFPDSSIHFAYAVQAHHFLSKAPEALQEKGSAAWNKGRVHYTNASKEVVDAYTVQFGEDASKFLEARAREIVGGGMLVIVMQGLPKDMPHSEVPTGMLYDCMGSILKDMASEGLLDESELDSFNLPYYAPTPEEMTKLIEANGCFSIEQMELTDPAPWLKRTSDTNIPEWITHVRAAMEAVFITHFGHQVTDKLFKRLTQQVSDKWEELDSKFRDKIQMLVVLKRKGTAEEIRSSEWNS